MRKTQGTGLPKHQRSDALGRGGATMQSSRLHLCGRRKAEVCSDERLPIPPQRHNYSVVT